MSSSADDSKSKRFEEELKRFKEGLKRFEVKLKIHSKYNRFKEELKRFEEELKRFEEELNPLEKELDPFEEEFKSLADEFFDVVSELEEHKLLLQNRGLNYSNSSEKEHKALELYEEAVADKEKASRSKKKLVSHAIHCICSRNTSDRDARNASAEADAAIQTEEKAIQKMDEAASALEETRTEHSKIKLLYQQQYTLLEDMNDIMKYRLKALIEYAADHISTNLHNSRITIYEYGERLLSLLSENSIEIEGLSVVLCEAGDTCESCESRDLHWDQYVIHVDCNHCSCTVTFTNTMCFS